MTNTTQTQENGRALDVLRRYSQKYMPRHPYHNSAHVEKVVKAVRELSPLEGISRENTYLLETAAYLHDIIFKIGAKDNEERSADVATRILPRLGYSPYQTQAVASLILATKMPTSPNGLLEQVICDSDVSNLGSDECLQNSELIRQELGIPAGLKWDKGNSAFLENHRYYTSSANQLYTPGLETNRIKIKEKIKEAESNGIH